MTTETDNLITQAINAAAKLGKRHGESAAGAQHTPGPWRVSGCCYIRNPHKDNWLHEPIIETIDAATNPRPSVATVNCRRELTEHEASKPDAETLANARLIAAAPELLSALRGLLDQLEAVGIYIEGEDSGQWQGAEGLSFNPAAEAIAKAEGRAE